MADQKFRTAGHQNRADRQPRHARFHHRGGGAGGYRSASRAERRGLAGAVVRALGRFHLPDGQARVRVRRCHARRGCGARGHAGNGLHRRRHRHLQPRIRARSARGRQAVRRRGADQRRLPRDRGAHHRVATRIGARHADGASHRQAGGRAVRRHLGTGARAGLSGALLAANGVRRRQRAVRHLGASADDGPGRAPDRHVPRRLRVSRRRCAVAPGRPRGPARTAAGRNRVASAGCRPR